MKILSSILAGIFLLGSFTSLAQFSPGSVTFPSPNAASLGIYGEVPVSYFTGIPNIGIPLYTLEGPGVKFPLSLNYYAGGIRPDIHPSWVGLNWSLNFGGVITRVVNKYPDEWKNEDQNYYGYYFSHNRLNNGFWSATDTLAKINTGWDNFFDKQPDEFSFNFLGYSGKFYLDHLGKWRVQSNDNIKVIFEETDFIDPFFHNCLSPSSSSYHPKCFGKFILVDNKGIKYTFGTDNAIEYSSNIAPPEMDYRLWLVATSWFLVDITVPYENSGFTIEYERGPFISNFQYFQMQDGFDANCAETNYGKGISGKVISPVYPKKLINKRDLSTIDFHFSKSNELTYPTSTYFEVFRDKDNTMVQPVPDLYFSFFLCDDQVPYYVNNALNNHSSVIDNSKFIWMKLDSLTFSSNDFSNNIVVTNTPLLSIKFNYIENANERLKLISLTKRSLLSNENNNELNYTFSYNYSDLPKYLEDISDHWGFVNGYDLPYTGYGGFNWLPGDIISIRSPNEYMCTRGLLKEITYPTGGKSIFEFEQNDYGKYVTGYDGNYPYAATTIELREPAGGVRIKKIINDDGLGNVDEREYYYVNDYNLNNPISSQRSSGVLAKLPKYRFHVNINYMSYYITMSNSIVPLTNSSGEIHIGYSEVVEKHKDGSYKILKYTNHDNGYNDKIPINTVTPAGLGIPYISRAFERGHLLSKEIFASDNKLIYKSENTYLRIGENADSNFVRSLNKEFGGYCKTVTVLPNVSWMGNAFILVPGCTHLYFTPAQFIPHYTTATAYGYLVYKFLLEKSEITTYSNTSSNLPLKTSNNYQYDVIGNIIKTTKSNSKGESIITNFKYPYQFAGVPVYDTMIGKNMLSFLVKSEVYNGSEFLESKITDYDFFPDNIIKPKQIRKKIGNAPDFIELKFNQYSSTGNLLEYEGIDGVKNAIVWSYFGSKPIAKIVGATYNEIAPYLTSNILGGPGPHQFEQSMLAEIDNLRTQFPNALVSTYLYNFDKGIKLMKDPNGISKYFEYDGMGRLKLIRDNELNIIKKYEFEYRKHPGNAIFYSNKKSGEFFNNNCPPCSVGKNLTYEVPAGKHSSAISQAAADQAAIDDLNINGQNYANSTGICVPANSCPFTSALNFETWNGNFSNNNGIVDVNLVIHPINNYYGSMWYGGVVVGYIDCICRPSGYTVVMAYEYDRTWQVNIESNGTVTLYLLDGPIPDGYTPYIEIITTYTVN